MAEEMNKEEIKDSPEGTVDTEETKKETVDTEETDGGQDTVEQEASPEEEPKKEASEEAPACSRNFKWTSFVSTSSGLQEIREKEKPCTRPAVERIGPSRN